MTTIWKSIWIGGVACCLLVACDQPASSSKPNFQQQLEEEKKKAAVAQRAAESANHRADTAGNALIAVLVVAGIAVFTLGRLAWKFYKNRQIIIRPPAYAIVDDSFVVDGANIVRGYGEGQPRSLLVLLTLLRVLLERGNTFKCFFDANTFYKLQEAKLHEEAYAYRLLCRQLPDWFIEVPGGVPADPEILAFAHSRGWRIISNDRYRDHQKTFPWTQSEPERRISGQTHSGHLFVTLLGVDEPIMPNLQEAEAICRRLIQSRVK